MKPLPYTEFEVECSQRTLAALLGENYEADHTCEASGDKPGPNDPPTPVKEPPDYNRPYNPEEEQDDDDDDDDEDLEDEGNPDEYEEDGD